MRGRNGGRVEIEEKADVSDICRVYFKWVLTGRYHRLRQKR